MTTDPARSHRNTRVVEAARLHRARHRKQDARTLIEGPNLLTAAIESGTTPEILFALPDDGLSETKAVLHDIELVRVDEAAMKRLAGTESPRGPVGVVSIPEQIELDGEGLIVSWGVSDPGNVGTLIRTAGAFGWGFAYTVGTADPWSPKVLRSGAGAQFSVTCGPVSKVEEVSQLGYTTVASEVSGGTELSSFPEGRYALVVGEEASGLPDDVVAAADMTVTIPMSGATESLNVSIAAGIIVYALSKP